MPANKVKKYLPDTFSKEQRVVICDKYPNNAVVTALSHPIDRYFVPDKYDERIGYMRLNKNIGFITDDIENLVDRTLDKFTIWLIRYILRKLAENIPFGKAVKNWDTWSEVFHEVDRLSTVIISIDEIQEQQSLKDRQNATNKIRESLNIIYGLSINFKNTGRLAPSGRLRILVTDDERDKNDYRIPTHHGEISVQVHQKFLCYISSKHYTLAPKKIWSINTKTKAAADSFAHFLLNQKAMNASTGGIIILTITKILSAIPEIPTYEEVMLRGKQVKQRIIKPIEKIFKLVIEDTFDSTWEYCNKNGEELTQEQLDNISVYKYWKDFRIKVTIPSLISQNRFNS